MTGDSAFKKQVRVRMAETGENYTTARRMVIARRDPGPPPAALRVYLSQYVDLDLTDDAARAYAAADEQGRRDMATGLLAAQIEASGSGERQVTADSRIVTDDELRAEAEDAVIRGAVQRGIERAVGVSTLDIDRTPGPGAGQYPRRPAGCADRSARRGGRPAPRRARGTGRQPGPAGHPGGTQPAARAAGRSGRPNSGLRIGSVRAPGRLSATAQEPQEPGRPVCPHNHVEAPGTSWMPRTR